MEKYRELHISVRQLVESIYRAGDIDIRFSTIERALEGSELHKLLQNKRKEEATYYSEVPLSLNYKINNFLISVDGRADGVMFEDEEITIEEIKSTTKSLNTIDVSSSHLAQAKCYAYIYAFKNEIDIISVQVTYINAESEDFVSFKETYTFEELDKFFRELIEKYISWVQTLEEWALVRDESIRKLEFPYPLVRDGQRTFIDYVSKVISTRGNLFVEAPTGIGKTIATLFPSIKAIGKKEVSKIFYLTPKSTTKMVAENTIKEMIEQGLRIKTISITARDKICFLVNGKMPEEEKDQIDLLKELGIETEKEEKEKISKIPLCDPIHCPYARGHFDRVNEALVDIFINESIINKEIVEDYAYRYKLCPYEFSLDISLLTDIVICDYNYAFDPRVYLRRFFDEVQGEYVFLIDEAHNLVDRAREMFSAQVSSLRNKEIIQRLRGFRYLELRNSLEQINDFLAGYVKNTEQYVSEQPPENFKQLIKSFTKEAQNLLQQDTTPTYTNLQLLELYFDILFFLKMLENYDSEVHITYAEKRIVEDKEDIILKIFCRDPSKFLKEALKKTRASIFFSATLSPIEYFKDVLGGNIFDEQLNLPSPYNKNNLLVMATNLSTRLNDRGNSIVPIVEYIYHFASSKKGNYIVFFPSYEYMRKVYGEFTKRYPEIHTLVQEQNMTEDLREEFLDSFNPTPDDYFVGFAVLGGIFSEGVDFKGDKLIGAVIVGVGFPSLTLEKGIIENYYNSKNKKGREYAYIYPGIIKVLQAAGRVIRSEKDVGAILLIDDRYFKMPYRALIRQDWRPLKSVRSPLDVKTILNRFWKERL